MPMSFQFMSFDQLSSQQLHDILQLREQVFQLEQKCLYPDVDGTDPIAMHVLYYAEQQLQAYLRIFEKNNTLHLGRIVIAKAARNQGLGKQLIQAGINYCSEHHPNKTIEISAQSHLQPYYEKLGFVRTSEPYDDHGIPHIDMVYDLSASST